MSTDDLRKGVDLNEVERELRRTADDIIAGAVEHLHEQAGAMAVVFEGVPKLWCEAELLIAKDFEVYPGSPCPAPPGLVFYPEGNGPSVHARGDAPIKPGKYRLLFAVLPRKD